MPEFVYKICLQGLYTFEMNDNVITITKTFLDVLKLLPTFSGKKLSAKLKEVSAT